MAVSILNFASFNMHGFNNGANMIADLCNTHKIIALQEHWLRPDGLDKLSLINKDFSFFASSGMEKSLSMSLLRGRPFGGVGFLFHNSLNNCLQLIGCDSSNQGRRSGFRIGGAKSEKCVNFVKVGGAKVAFRPPSKILEGATIIYAERGGAGRKGGWGVYPPGGSGGKAPVQGVGGTKSPRSKRYLIA